MRKLVSLLCGVLTFACLLPVFVSALPRSFRPMPGLLQPSSMSSPWSPAPAPSRPQVAKGESERRPDIRSIKVICHPDYMEIQMDADLLGIGVPVDVADIRLGQSEQTGEACRAYPTETNYEIAAPLTDCGTEHVITAEQLIYTNTLEYSPALYSDGVIRTQPASFPVECYYKRKFDLSSIPVMPTWVPFMSTRADEGQLEFSLHLMTDDWAFQRAAPTYYLGDVINIEASVERFNHNPMRVFVDHCVATVAPEADSEPRYDFIERGCLMDGFLTGSRSQFLPRLQHDKLRFQLDAFRFHQEERSELYISCLLRAETEAELDSMSRACSFMDDRWHSADSEDWLCDSCMSMPISPQSSASSQKSSVQASHSSAGNRGGSSSAMVHLRPRSASSSLDSSRGWEKQERVGPISVLKKTKRPLAPPEAPEAMHGLPQPMPEPEMAASAKMGPRSYPPRSDGLSRALDKPAVDQSPDDGNVNQFFDLWKKQASPKDWAELMGLLQKASSPAVTTAESTTVAPAALPSQEEPTAPPTLLPLTTDFEMADLKLEDAMDMHPSSLALLKEEERHGTTSGNKGEGPIKR